LKSLLLSKSGAAKIRSHQVELKQADVEDSIRSLSPGEWCWLHHPTLSQNILCFINPLVDEKQNALHVLDQTYIEPGKEVNPVEYINFQLKRAIEKRKKFKNYGDGSRLVYGASDGLPGLIVDQFKDATIIQINTAGIDKYRNEIKDFIQDFTKTNAYFLDQKKSREKEALPFYENPPLPDIKIFENNIEFNLRSEVIQKVGFYYDHRENRSQLIRILSELNHNFKNGIDLFCYIGAWGLTGLKAGLDKMIFVDQGDFLHEINHGLEKNQFKNKGDYVRSDVFKYLDQAIAQGNKFDVILCDPPAFAKSLQQKDQALDGYSKLHRKVLKVASPGSLIAFSSCTHYVTHDEFQKNILDAAFKENKKIQLIYTGMQGWDHPIKSQLEKSNYIKSYFYLLES
jgi:23S rRNA (cytosine1962-C5)-methyltransferase